jgi:hypothetical protein
VKPTLLLALLLCALPAAAEAPPMAFNPDTKDVSRWAGDHVETSRSGKRIVWSEHAGGTTMIARDASGRAVAEWSRDSTGEWHRRDGTRLTPTFTGGYVLRRNGRTIGSIDRRFGGRTIVRDGRGRVVNEVDPVR